MLYPITGDDNELFDFLAEQQMEGAIRSLTQFSLEKIGLIYLEEK